MAGQSPPSRYQIWKALEALRKRCQAKTKGDAKERRPELDRARAVHAYLEGRRYATAHEEDLGQGD